MPLRAPDIETACRRLSASDPVMRDIIRLVGPFTLRPERDRFWMLVRSIISQQISVAAARSIRTRLQQLAAPRKITPDTLLALDDDELRSAGISPQKLRYLRDLAGKSLDGTVKLSTIGRLSDEAVIAQLTQVTGIGRWTAQMFLIFALGRPDVFPEDDLGVRMAIRDRYGLDELPDRSTSREIAHRWRPYASVASWYCWRSLNVSSNGEDPDVTRGFPA